MGAVVIKEALKRAGVAPEQVDHVYMGCVIQAGLGQNVARQMSLKAGLPVEVPAVTLNVVCGSGLNAVNAAADMINQLRFNQFVLLAEPFLCVWKIIRKLK